MYWRLIEDEEIIRPTDWYYYDKENKWIGLGDDIHWVGLRYKSKEMPPIKRRIIRKKPNLRLIECDGTNTYEKENMGYT